MELEIKFGIKNSIANHTTMELVFGLNVAYFLDNMDTSQMSSHRPTLSFNALFNVITESWDAEEF